MLLIPKITGHSHLPLSSMEAQNKKKSYSSGNGNLETQNHQVQTNILSKQSFFTCAAFAHTFRKSAWEAGFEWPFGAESASFPVIPVPQTGVAGMAARAHPTVQLGPLGQPHPRHWTFSWGRWWAEDWWEFGSVDGYSRQGRLWGAEDWPGCAITGAGAENLEQGLMWSPGLWAG